MEKCRSVPHDHSSAYYASGLEYEEGGAGAATPPAKAYSFNGPGGREDPEAKRRRRVASYNVFAAQGRLKSSVRSSLKWIKAKFSDIRYGAL